MPAHGLLPSEGTAPGTTRPNVAERADDTRSWPGDRLLAAHRQPAAGRSWPGRPQRHVPQPARWPSCAGPGRDEPDVDPLRDRSGGPPGRRCRHGARRALAPGRAGSAPPMLRMTPYRMDAVAAARDMEGIATGTSAVAAGTPRAGEPGRRPLAGARGAVATMLEGGSGRGRSHVPIQPTRRQATNPEPTTPPCRSKGAFVLVRGVLLSHAVSRAVPSALEGLTSGFGM